ncbi:MAG: PilZ domain-containing protein [Thiogranum sp.]
MEHRCSVRKPLEFQLLLYKHGLPIQSGVCRNLGLGGLFIETGHREWRKNEYLEVEILGPSGLPSMRLPAVVVHSNASGAGLAFDVVTGAQRRRLRDWLFEKRPQEPSPATGRAAVA